MSPFAYRLVFWIRESARFFLYSSILIYFFLQTIATLLTLFAAVSALNNVQVVNQNANLQSSNNYPYGGGGYNRPNNHFYVSGAVRTYNHGYQPYSSGYPDNYYPSQGYRYRRQISPIVKEANAQYQHQGSNQYDEKINPSYYGGAVADSVYPYSDAYRYRENNQYQLQGNAQSRVEGDPRIGDQFNNLYQSQQQGALYRQRYQY